MDNPKIRRAVENVLPSVIEVSFQGSDRKINTCGIIVDSDGTIITSASDFGTRVVSWSNLEGGDSMIRDGKRSISRDLDRFLHLIDEFSAKRNKISSIGLTNSRTRILYNGQNIENTDFIISGRDKRGLKERMRARVDDHDDDDAGIIELENFRVLNNGKIGSLPKRNGGFSKRHGGDQAKAKKNVTFAENGHISRGFVCTREPNSSEDGSVDEERERLASH